MERQMEGPSPESADYPSKLVARWHHHAGTGGPWVGGLLVGGWLCNPAIASKTPPPRCVAATLIKGLRQSFPRLGAPVAVRDRREELGIGRDVGGNRDGFGAMREVRLGAGLPQSSESGARGRRGAKELESFTGAAVVAM